ncbi:MAG: hypothetical protein J6B21_06665, partial [Oscillospiraceae bacterium]|nr:hypothetical protein [Oscillospiraceae bacterium]
AVVASLAISVYIFVLDLIPSIKAPCLLVISAKDSDNEIAIMQTVKKHAPKAVLKSRNITLSGMELILEAATKNPSAITDEIAAIDGVTSVNILSHSGELRI